MSRAARGGSSGISVTTPRAGRQRRHPPAPMLSNTLTVEIDAPPDLPGIPDDDVVTLILAWMPGSVAAEGAPEPPGSGR